MSAEHDKKEVDAVSGVETTGHEWDGIKELNNPLPSWWLWTLLHHGDLGPALHGRLPGLADDHRRDERLARLLVAHGGRGGDRRGESGAGRLRRPHRGAGSGDDPRRSGAAFLRAGRRRRRLPDPTARSATAPAPPVSVGYPNLLDDDWIWGGDVAAIEHTIRHGIRQTDAEGYTTDETRQNEMPAFGRDELLEDAEIDTLAAHVRRLAGQDVSASETAGGAELYADNCAACHGDEGLGDAELGAPNLTDAIWLYGGDQDAVRMSIVTGRGGMMPAWGERLSDATVKQLALYVHSLGGGE